MFQNNWKWIAAAAALIIVLGVLFYLPRAGKKSVSTDVPCLNPNTPIVQHIHPTLTISIDEVLQSIPANVGLGACERALHTHDSTGVIHVEAQDQRQYTLGDFFSVWGESLDKPGYTRIMTVDGQADKESGHLILRDKQQIEIRYTKTSP